MRSRTLLVAVTTAALVAFPTGVWAAGGFTDVPDGKWYSAPISWLAAKKITTGCSPTEFCPNRGVTRAEMATFLHRASGNGSVAPSFNADKVDGKDASAFLGATAKAKDADRLDGKDASAFLGATAKAKDADRLDGIDSSAFARTTSFYTIASVVSGLEYSAPMFEAAVFCDEGDLAISAGYFEAPDQFVRAAFAELDYGYVFYEDQETSDVDMVMNVTCLDVGNDHVSGASVTSLAELGRAQR